MLAPELISAITDNTLSFVEAYAGRAVASTADDAAADAMGLVKRSIEWLINRGKAKGALAEAIQAAETGRVDRAALDAARPALAIQLQEDSELREFLLDVMHQSQTAAPASFTVNVSEGGTVTHLMQVYRAGDITIT